MSRPAARVLIDAVWDSSIVPTLESYIRIPNKSPIFDPDWAAHGHMARALKLLADWCLTQPLRGMKVEPVSLPDLEKLLSEAEPAR